MRVGFLNLCAEGFEVHGLSHDEAFATHPHSPVNEQTLQLYIKCLCDMPKWADGLPVEAEGFITERYRKG
jgi:hypothetical protein